MHAPFLELGSTVLFLVLTEYTQLVLWAMLGLLGLRAEVSRSLLAVAAGVAMLWLFVRWLLAPRAWSIARTFRLATPRRYATIVLLRAPMFFVSLVLHYQAAHAFGFHIPFGHLLTFLPVIFMVAALPVTVAHLGSTQAAWIFFFSQYDQRRSCWRSASPPISCSRSPARRSACSGYRWPMAICCRDPTCV